MPLFNPPSRPISEVPAGAIDDANKDFALTHTPVAGSVQLFKNGLLQRPTDDYVLSGKTASFGTAPATNSSNPPADDVRVAYLTQE